VIWRSISAYSVIAALLLSSAGAAHAAVYTRERQPETILTIEETDEGNTVNSWILAVRGGAVRVVTRDRNVSHGPLMPSPSGRHIAFVAYSLTCCTPQRSGIWTFNRDGSHEHQVVPLPRSPCGNQVAIGSIAWAPGGLRLAYTVAAVSDALRACHAGVRDVMGTWVTPYQYPRPRQVSFGGNPQGNDPLSWSPDGQMLAVNRLGGVRAVSVTTGKSQFTIRGAQRGVFAPVTGTLAYSTGGLNAGQPTVIWAVGTHGRHRHVLATVQQPLAPPEADALTWSPDGRSIAFLTDTGRVLHPGVRSPGIRSIWTAGAISHLPRTVVVDPTGSIRSPVWSPRSASIAYIGSCACGSAPPTAARSAAIWLVAIASGARHLVLSATPRGAGRSSSQFSTIAWVSE
jgi:WD40 repeat protein